MLSNHYTTEIAAFSVTAMAPRPSGLPGTSGLKSKLLLGAALGLMLGALPSSAMAGGGGGLAIGMLNGRDSSGFDNRGASIGLEGVKTLGGRFLGPEIRFGGELKGIGSPGDGAGVQAGLFGDVVFTRIANADLYAGLGLGFAGGQALLGPLAEGPGVYARPELGSQWNLGRMAVNARLELMVLPGMTGAESPAHYAGLSVGLLFGDFPPFARGERPRGPGRPVPPPPPPRPGRRTGPGAPPPPRY